MNVQKEVGLRGMTVYCDGIPILEGDLDSHEGW